MLIDRARVFVKAGDGGNGSSSFRREKFVPRGGPDGGDGAQGGDIILQVQRNLNSLLPYQYNQKFKAKDGGQGRSQKMHGKNGESLVLEIPPGVMVWDDETGELLADLTEPDSTAIVARGGKGGLGNVHFKSSVHQAPRISELGEPGEERWLRMELRLIADVGLVGLPNAGKSTLLAAVSRARPKVADYPFTTLEPNLGVVEIGGQGGQVFVMADIPGLIEGAAEGAGLGHEFLRHVTRTVVLLHVVDASGGLEGRDPLPDFETINAELVAYDESLAEKPMLVALNKIDLVEARDRVPALKAAIEAQGYPVFAVSGATGEGIATLLEAVAASVRDEQEKAREEEVLAARTVFTLPKVDEKAWEVSRVARHQFVVTGKGIERFALMTDFANDEGVDRFQRVMKSSGIFDELEDQGIENGDLVQIADHELVWGDQDFEDFEAKVWSKSE